MPIQNMRNFKWAGLTALLVSVACVAAAQQRLPADTEAAQVADAIAQTSGEFDAVNLGYIHSLGMQQKAWNDPLAHMGEGQTKPGYSKYMWSPDVVLPVRLREGMMTLINLPVWELIEKVHIGSPESFGGEIASPNSLLLYADPSYIGVDSNMIIFGRSGNRYVFYLRSETYNTDKITQSVVDVIVGLRYTPATEGGMLGNFNGATATGAATSASGGGNAPGWASKGGMTPGGAQNPQIGLNTASTGPKDWLGTIPVNPEDFRFDIDIFLPNPADVDIAPDNVWRDNIFTYIDFGPKALTMTQRPIVNKIEQESEVPVGFRTRGPNSRLIVVEAIGDLVLRNGKKIICLKLRRDPASGLEYIDYSGHQATADTWQAGPSVQKSGLDYADAMLARKQPALTMGGDVIAHAPADAALPMGEALPPCPLKDCPAYQLVAQQKMAPLPVIPADVRLSQNAAAGIRDVIGTGLAPASAAPPAQEYISVELAAHANIAQLEAAWDKIYAQNEDILRGYEPYYSLETTADADVRELFRLRVGPVKDVKTGDALCRKLGRRGFACSVIRVQ